MESKRGKIHYLALVAGFLWATSHSNVAAEPGPVGRWLIETPVSLLSFGIFRAEQQMQKAADAISNRLELQPEFVAGSANYNWKENRINLVLIVGSASDTLPPNLLESICSQAVASIRTFGGVLNGSPILGEASTYANLFEPIGYSRKDAPEDLSQKLDHIIRIIVSINSSNTRLMICEAPLMGTGYSIARE